MSETDCCDVKIDIVKKTLEEGQQTGIMNISKREELSQRGLHSTLKIKVEKLDEEPVSMEELLNIKEGISSD